MSRRTKKVAEAKRTKRDSSAVIAHEAAANTAEARAQRDERKGRRVRATLNK